MTYVVVLEFEDEDAAKRYVVRGLDCLMDDKEVYDAKVVGAYKKPDSYCRCSEFGIRNRGRAYVRGDIFGWWVCPSCKKVTRHVYHFFSQLGFINLIPQEIRAAQGEVFVNPVQTERSKYEWSFLLDTKDTSADL